MRREPGLTCPRCKYALSKLRTARCPECGLTIDLWQLPDARRPRTWREKLFDEEGCVLVLGIHVSIFVAIVVMWAGVGKQGWITDELFRIDRRTSIPNYALVALPTFVAGLAWATLIDEWHIKWFRPQLIAACLMMLLIPVHAVALISLCR